MLSSTLQHEAYTCIDEIGRLTCPHEVAARLQRSLAALGCEHTIFCDLPGRGERLEEFVILHTMPSEFYNTYIEQRFIEICPLARQCRRTILPFEWSEAPFDPEREPRTARVLSMAADFGMPRGLTIPVPVADRAARLSAVAVSGPRLDLGPAPRQAMHLMALYGFERLRDLMGQSNHKPRVLTPREREVLNWVAQGKSAWEIGEILDIAKRTVDEHVQSAVRKLGAVNRTHAVALAVRDRVIEI